MRYLILLFIPILLSSCRKTEQFTPCDEFNSLIGTWKSIDQVESHIITIDNNGLYTNIIPMERDFKLHITSCEPNSLTHTIYGSTYNSLLCKVYEENISAFVIFHTVNYDTILDGGGAYNHEDYNQGYIRRFVRVK